MKDAPPPGPLLSLAEVARRVHVHPKTLRQLLPGLMEREPRLRLRKVGRSLMFTEADYEMLIETMAWQMPSIASKPVRTIIQIRKDAASVQKELRNRLDAKLTQARAARKL